jgi:GT2 family glycosyltransferase
MTKQFDISIVILSYNTKDLLFDCLTSLLAVVKELPFEVIVVDNNSPDGTVDFLQSAKISRQMKPLHLQIVANTENLGFAKGNNSARTIAKGKYILFLNPDTLVHKGTLTESFSYITDHSDIGAITCKILLPDGSLDKDARRSFPTPWVALTHFSKLDKIFPTSQFFSRYWYGYISSDTIHDIDSLQGAFCLSPKRLLDDIGWFDETYFLDGEDIDLCWKIHEAGYRIVYFPPVSITHIKGASKGKIHTKIKRSVDSRKRFVLSGLASMEIFYRKHLWKRYPFFVNWLVLFGIRTLTLFRLIHLIFTG